MAIRDGTGGAGRHDRYVFWGDAGGDSNAGRLGYLVKTWTFSPKYNELDVMQLRAIARSRDRRRCEKNAKTEERLPSQASVQILHSSSLLQV